MLISILTVCIIGFLSYFYYYLNSYNLESYLELCEKYSKKDRPLIMAFYGHTSYLDGIILLYNIIFRMKEYRILTMIAKHYQSKIPSFIHKYCFFVETQKKTNQSASSNTKLNNGSVLNIAIEGTRKYKDHLHSGYYYIAKNNSADLVYIIIDFRNRRPYFSSIIEYEQMDGMDNDRLLQPLKDLTEKYDIKNYSFYSKHVAPICFATNKIIK
jgi:hypothetical protein